jgi:repressor of nif and glnA expression
MKCIKNCIKQIKKNEKNENKNEKKNKKMEAKLTKEKEKKNKIQEIRKRIKNLTYDEKFDMVTLKYSKILNLVHNTYEAIDEIIKIVPNSFYYDILLKDEYKERIPEIVTEIIIN